MINNKEILYIKQGNRETIIYTINNIIHISKTIENVFDEWCIDTLSTYKGRLGKKYTVVVGSGKNTRTETRIRYFSISGVH